MITEDYVSFETAKLLKEKGFNEECFAFYNPNGTLIQSGVRFNNIQVGRVEGSYSAPTHQMAMKWLREVYNIDIDIEAAVGMLGVKVYIPYISKYKLLEDTSSKVRQIKRGMYYKDDSGVIPALQHFASYEEAVEAALKYSLENLI